MVSLLERKVVGLELSLDVRIAGIWSKAIGILFPLGFRPIPMRNNPILALVVSAGKDLGLQHITDKSLAIQ